MPVYRRKYKDKGTGETRLGSYYFKFVVDGVTYKETVKTARTKKQAEEAERQARQDIHDGVYGGKGRRMLFSDFVKTVFLPWAEQHHKSYYQTSLNMERLCEYFAGRTLGQISPLAVEGLKVAYSKGEGMFERPHLPATTNSILSALSGVLTRAVEHKFLRSNPCSEVKYLSVEEGPIRRLEPAEEEALLKAAELEEAYLKPMIQLALWTGFRQGELISLKKGAVDFARNRIFVTNPKWKRDKRKTEGNPMSASARELLLRLASKAKGDFLFTRDDGTRLKRCHVDYAYRRACARAGLNGFNFHSLRHEYGSRLGDADVNLKKIARLMGHSRTRQTERYVHPDEAGLLAATEIAARPTIVPQEQERGRLMRA